MKLLVCVGHKEVLTVKFADSGAKKKLQQRQWLESAPIVRPPLLFHLDINIIIIVILTVVPASASYRLLFCPCLFRTSFGRILPPKDYSPFPKSLGMQLRDAH